MKCGRWSQPDSTNYTHYIFCQPLLHPRQRVSGKRKEVKYRERRHRWPWTTVRRCRRIDGLYSLSQTMAINRAQWQTVAAFDSWTALQQSRKFQHSLTKHNSNLLTGVALSVPGWSEGQCFYKENIAIDAHPIPTLSLWVFSYSCHMICSSSKTKHKQLDFSNQIYATDMCFFSVHKL